MKANNSNFLKLLSLFTLLVLWAVPQTTFAQAKQPGIEYSSLLDAFTVKFLGERGRGKTGGHLVLNQKHAITGVFFPEGANLDVDLVRAGNEQSLFKRNCVLTKNGGISFTSIQVGGNGGYTFKEEGDYELRFVLNGKIITKLPFNVFFKNSGDDFDPKTYTFVDGDWSRLAYLSHSADKNVSPLKFNTWTRKIVFSTSPEPSRMDVTLLQGDEIVAVTRARNRRVA